MSPISMLLAISVAANALLGWAYLGQRDKTTEAKTQTVQATTVAVECGKATEKLETKAVERKAAAAPKIAAAKEKAREAEKRADVILATPAAKPGDVCASAQARVDDWWEKRK